MVAPMRGLLVVLAGVVCTTRVAAADMPSQSAAEVPAPVAAASTEPVRFRYAAMTQDECEAELTARQIVFVRETAKGVLAPVRLKGPLKGIEFRSNDKNAERRATSIWEIADCRLVLALDDFADILAAHDIVELRHYSMYRRAPERWPDDKIGTRHHGGLALDAAHFVKKDGSELDVLDDFAGRRHRKVCGEKAPKGKTPEARELREIVCEAMDRGLFSVILTPNFNRAHRNHFHLEVTPGVKWMLLR
jgi:hypothetical protein